MTGKNIPGEYRNRSNSSRKLPVILRWSHAIFLPFPFFGTFPVLFSPRCYTGGSLLDEWRPRRSRERSRAALSREELALPALLSSSSCPRSPSHSSTLLSTRSFIPGRYRHAQSFGSSTLWVCTGITHTYTQHAQPTQNASLQCAVALILRQAEYRLQYTARLYCCVCAAWLATSSKYPFSLLSRDAKSRKSMPSTLRVYARLDLTRFSRSAIISACLHESFDSPGITYFENNVINYVFP